MLQEMKNRYPENEKERNVGLATNSVQTIRESKKILKMSKKHFINKKSSTFAK
jgi:hypothetical protein